MIYAYILALLAPFFIFRPKDPFQPEFSANIYFIIFIGLGPVTLYFWMPEKLHGDSQWNNILLIATGYLSINLGYFSARIIKLKFSFFRNLSTQRTDTLKHLAVFLISISFVFLAIYFLRAGQIPMLADNKEAARVAAQSVSGNGYILYMITLGMTGVLVLSAYHYNYKPNGQEMGVVIISIIVGMLILMVGSRRYLMWILIYLVMARHYLKSPIKLRYLFAFGVFCLFVVNAFELIRNSKSDTTESLAIATLYRFVIYYSNFSKVVETFANESLLLGKTFFMDVATILPGKQIDYQTWLKEMTGLEFEGFGLPPTLIGDMYINFSIYGVTIGCFVTGLIYKTIYQNLVSEPYICPLSVVIYILISKEYFNALAVGVSAQSVSIMWLAVVLSFIYSWNNLFFKIFPVKKSGV